MHMFKSPFGEIQLSRLPIIANDQYQAWDAADNYLLQYCDEQQLISKGTKILVINDQFGALTVALSSIETQSIDNWSDSYISHLSATHNLSCNHLDSEITYLPSTQAINNLYDLILIKLPKTTALLETQLNGLGEHLTENGQIIAAGMCKHMPTSTYGLFEKHIGTTSTSLAVKKARLIFANNECKPKINLPYPVIYHQQDIDLTLANHANVFSKERLDIGARFFIEHFKELPQTNTLLDLGCGNGVLGIMAKVLDKAENIAFVDESYMAIASAKSNYQTAHGTLNNAEFFQSESLSQVTAINPDIILCNPPFHQQHQVGDTIAKRMFKQSADLLKNQGELWVVANRHLDYYPYLNRFFKQCSTVASNKKFNIYRAVKSD